MDDKKQVNIESLLKKLEQFKPQENIVKKKEDTLINSSDWYLAGEGKSFNGKDSSGNDKLNSLEKTLGALDKRKKELEIERKELAKLESRTPEEDKAVRKDYITDKKTNISFGDYQIKKQKNFSKILKWGAIGASTIVAVVLVIMWILNITPSIPDTINFQTNLTSINIGEEEMLYAQGNFTMKVTLPSNFKNNTINLSVDMLGVSLSKTSVKPNETFTVVVSELRESLGRVTINAQYENTTKNQEINIYIDRQITSLEFAKQEANGQLTPNITNPGQADSLEIEGLDDLQKIANKTTFYVGQYATLTTKSVPELKASNYRDILYDIVPSSQRYDIQYNPGSNNTSSFRADSNNIPGDGDDVIEISPDGKYIIAKRPGIARVKAKVQKWLDGSGGYIETTKEIEIKVTFPVISSCTIDQNLDLFIGQENTLQIKDILKFIKGKYEIHQYGQYDGYIPEYYKTLDNLTDLFKGIGWFNIQAVSQPHETISVKSQTNGAVTFNPVNDTAVAAEAPVKKQHTINIYLGGQRISAVVPGTLDNINVKLYYQIDYKADVSAFENNLKANILAFNGKNYVQSDEIDSSLISFASPDGSVPFNKAFEVRYEIYEKDGLNAVPAMQSYFITKDGETSFAPKEDGVYLIKSYLVSVLPYDITGTYTGVSGSELEVIPAGGRLYYSLSDDYFTITVSKLTGTIENKNQIETNFLKKLSGSDAPEDDFRIVTSERTFDTVSVANGKAYISGTYGAGESVLSGDIVNFAAADASSAEFGSVWKEIASSGLELFDVSLGETYRNLPISDAILNTYFNNLIMCIESDSEFVINAKAYQSPDNIVKVRNNKVGTTNIKLSFRTLASQTDEFSITNINLITRDNILSIKESFRSLSSQYPEFTFGGGEEGVVKIPLDFKLNLKNLTNYINEYLLTGNPYETNDPLTYKPNYRVEASVVAGVGAYAKFMNIDNNNGTIIAKPTGGLGDFIDGDILVLDIEIKRKNIDWNTGFTSLTNSYTSLEVPMRGTITFEFDSDAVLSNL